GELYAELLAQLGERVELVQLTNPVPAVSGLAPFRDDQGLRLEVAEHARRPTRAPTRLPDSHPCPHPGEPYQSRVKVLGRRRALTAVQILEADDVVQVIRRDLDH